MITYAGAVLAGGRARRLGGLDKTALRIGKTTPLERALAALAGASTRIVVGPEVDGGPVHAIASAVSRTDEPWIVVLAGDLPFVTLEAVETLLHASGADGAIAIDGDGRDQPLLGAYRVESLRAALPQATQGARLKDLIARLTLARIPLPGVPPPWWDCDTEADLMEARKWA
jgi:molybdopterin-guanine dinucleotide biosynthesis protein A